MKLINKTTKKELFNLYEKYGKYFINHINDKELKLKIINKSKKEDKTLLQILFNLINDIKDNPKCKSQCCNNKTKYINFKKGYQLFCSTKCSNNDENVKTKVKQTNMKRYGCDNPQKNKEIREKTEQTNLKKYGYKTNLQNIHQKEKIEKTNIEKYNSITPLTNKTIQQKTQATLKNKYNVKNYSQRNIKNINNYNKEYIENNFVKEGIIDINEISKYFNISITNSRTIIKKLKVKFEKYKKNNDYINEEELLFIKIKEKLQDEKIIFNIYSQKIIKYFDKNSNHSKKIELDIYIEIFETDKNKIIYNNLDETEKDIKENQKLVRKIAIEYNGIMFHSFGKSKYSMFDNKHTENDILCIYNNKTYLNKDKHKLKSDLSDDNNLHLIHIFDIDFKKPKNQNKILKYIYNILINESINFKELERKIKNKKKYIILNRDFFNINLIRKYLNPNKIKVLPPKKYYFKNKNLNTNRVYYNSGYLKFYF